MTIFDVLAERQRELETLFRRTTEAFGGGRSDEARSLAQELTTKLLACMRAEHSIVYPCFAFSAGLGDEVARAIEEHGRIEDAINWLRIGPQDDWAWRGALTALQLMVANHVETEEYFLFPVARLRLTPEQASQLAREFATFEPLAASVAQPSITYDLVA